ncbi:MAG: tol-pal system protein YbgF [Acidobacteriota bacterium]
MTVPATRMRSALLGLALIPLVLAGCGGDRITDIETELNSVKKQVARMQKEQEEQKELLAKMSADMEDVRKVAARVNADGSSLQDAVDTLGQRLTETNARMDKLSAKLGATAYAVDPNASPTAPGIPLPPSGGSGGTAEQMLETANGDFTKGNYSLSVLEFQQVVDQHPESDLADNAQYGLAESYFAQRKYDDAIREYDKILARYPGSEKVPSAYLKKGFAFLELNQTAQGVVALQYLIGKYPKSQEADVARRRLESMGLKPR